MVQFTGLAANGANNTDGEGAKRWRRAVTADGADAGTALLSTADHTHAPCTVHRHCSQHRGTDHITHSALFTLLLCTAHSAHSTLVNTLHYMKIESAAHTAHTRKCTI